MADMFVNGLAAGLIILAAMLIVANTNWSGVGHASSFSWFGSQGQQPELITAELGKSYQVGLVVNETTEQFNLGQFEIDGRPTEVELPGGVVESGVLFGDQTLKYSLENPKSVQFTVVQTNNYAPLVIKVDGQVVAERSFELGEYTIMLNRKGAVELEFSVPSSGWRLWAPVLYELDDISAIETNPTVEYGFTRGEDFYRAELVLALETRQGRLNVDVNGKTVWSGTPGVTQTIPLTVSTESNTVTLNAGAGSTFAGQAALRKIYRHSEEKVYETTLNLTSAQIDKLPGYITFEVPSIQRKGTIVVEFVSGNQIKLAQAVDTEYGAHSIAFWKSNIVPNNLTHVVIEGGDNALFTLRNVKVWV